MKVSYHFAKQEHVAGILKIYTPFITSSHTSFESIVPSEEEMWLRIKSVQIQDVWMVALRDREVIGYAYASIFRARRAYNWVREVSVYVHPDHLSMGIGGALYLRLFALMRAQGYRKVLAGIALPNDASVRFHERIGFLKVAHFEDVGYKFGKWISIGFWELLLTTKKKMGEVRSMDEIKMEVKNRILADGA